MVSHASRPIADLPADWEDLARPDLDELLRQWQEECRYVAQPERIRELEERLATTWAIEAGILGRLYSLGPKTVDALSRGGLRAVERLRLAGGISDDAANRIKDHRAALDLAITLNNRDRPLTLSFVMELHRLLTRSQAPADDADRRGDSTRAETVTRAGSRTVNTPTTFDGAIREHCAPDVVRDEIERVIEMHHRHLELGISPEVEAAWLHHRLTRVHPFPDCDRRLAHTLATAISLQAGFVPLVIRNDVHREAYFDALGEADTGDLKPLVDLFANIMSADLNDAITFVRSTHGRDIGAIAAAAVNAAKRGAIHDERSVRLITDNYRRLAGTKLRDVAGQLSRVFTDAFPGLPSDQHAWIVSDDLEIKMSTGARGRWRDQIVRVAGEYHYTPDLSQYKRWVALKLPVVTPDAQRWHVVVSLHHKESRAGVMAAILFLTTSDDADARTSEDDVARPAIAGARREFIHSGSHPQDDRFVAWLDAALTTALEEWQSRI